MIIRSLLRSVFMGIFLLGAAGALQVEEVSWEQTKLLEFIEKIQYAFLMDIKSNALPEKKEERDFKVKEILSQRSEHFKKGMSKRLYVYDPSQIMENSPIGTGAVVTLSLYPSFLVKEDQKTSVVVNVGLVSLTENPELLFNGINALAEYGYKLYPNIPYLSYTPKDYNGFSKFLSEQKYAPKNFEGYTLEPVNFLAFDDQWYQRDPN